jgi:hypothetical protein
MKRTFTIFCLFTVVLTGSSSYVLNNTGIAGRTGSPGETTCTGGGQCHGGGSSATKGVTISAVPDFTNDQYYADSIYQINITVGAVGFSRFGFGCEILDSLNANAGQMQSPGLGVKFLNIGRLNATHTAPRAGANGTTFSFQWHAPLEGRVNFYVCGNAVNNNNTTTGDLPIPAYLALYPAFVEPPVDTTGIDGIKEIKNNLTNVSLYPNPASGIASLQYSLNKPCVVKTDLLNAQGTLVKEFKGGFKEAGSQSQLLLLHDIAPGVYVLRTSLDGQQSSQKLLTIQ